MTTGSSSIQSHRSSALSYSACSDIGRKREENQDSFGVHESDKVSFYVVADGMGGAQGGAVASTLAVEIFKNELQKKEAISVTDLSQAVTSANTAVFDRGMSDPSLAGMGTTLVALVFHDKRLHILHVGDSRAYRVRAGEIARLTEDHTLVQELVKAGTISLDQAQNHPVAHMLTRSLGPASKVRADYTLPRDAPLKGDRYLLCSDGLYNLVSDKEIQEKLSSDGIESAVQSLVATANERGGIDNITVLAVEVGEGYPTTIEELTACLPPEENEKKSESIVTEERPGEPGHGSGGEFERQVSLESLREALREQRRQSEMKADESARRSFAAARSGRRDDEDEEGEEPEVEKKRLQIPMTITWIVGVVVASIGGFLFALVIFAPRLHPLAAPKPVVMSGPVQLQTAPTPVPPTAAPIQEPKPDLAPLRQVQLLDKRRHSLTGRIREIENLLSAFETAAPERVAEILNETALAQSDLETKIERLRSETDDAARTLSVWYDRRVRLESTDALSMAGEIAVISESVRGKKQNFENVTWAYLSEAEKLKFNPGEETGAQRLAELIKARKEALRELAEEIRKVVDLAVAAADKRIAEISVEREQLEIRLRRVKEERELAQLIQGGDETAKRSRIESLKAQREAALAELAELEHAVKLLEPVTSVTVPVPLIIPAAPDSPTDETVNSGDPQPGA